MERRNRPAKRPLRGLAHCAFLLLVQRTGTKIDQGNGVMARKIVIASMALAALGMATPLAAQTVDDDVRCLVVANSLSRAEKDPTQRQVAGVMSIFYLGRLDARISTEQLKAAITARVKTMPASSLGPTVQACFKRMEAKGNAMRGFQVKGSGSTPPAKKK
jgi:hypothetical protein